MLVNAIKQRKKKEKDDRDLELQYKVLYSKIGRDFVTREEFIFILNSLFNEEQDAILGEALSLAVEKASQYYELYENNDIGEYQDLIDLSEDTDATTE